MDDKIKTTPQDVFFQFLSLVTLIIVVVSMITLLFQYINALFPDHLSTYFSYTHGYGVMRTAISSMIVVWPIYVLSMYLVRKQERQNLYRASLPVKKWFTYLILFVAAITIIIDLITLINNFLGGELSSQFFLKILVVLVVAVVVFGYYIWTLRKNDPQSTLPRWLTLVVSVIIIASIVIGFFVIGTPGEQRARRFDEKRVNNLQLIQSEVINYWNKKGFLPNELSDLTDDIKGYQVPNDPLTQAGYTYRMTGDVSFELCAEFQTEYKSAVSAKTMYEPYFFANQSNWNHGIGEQCFTRVIDPELHSTESSPLPVR